jgi:hypothetical protein
MGSLLLLSTLFPRNGNLGPSFTRGLYISTLTMSDKRHKYKLHVRCFGESFLLVVKATDSCAVLLGQILQYYKQFYHHKDATNTNAFPFTAHNVVLRAIVKKPTDQPTFSDVMDLSYL